MHWTSEVLWKNTLVLRISHWRMGLLQPCPSPHLCFYWFWVPCVHCNLLGFCLTRKGDSCGGLNEYLPYIIIVAAFLGTCTGILSVKFLGDVQKGPLAKLDASEGDHNATKLYYANCQRDPNKRQTEQSECQALLLLRQAEHNEITTAHNICPLVTPTLLCVMPISTQPEQTMVD